MTLWFSFNVNFPTAELTFWWPEVSWKPSSLAVTGGGALWKRKNCLLNTFAKTFLTKNNQLFSWTFLTWLVTVMSVDRGARAWFGELSWHLKVPWNLISAKRFPIHTVPMQIEGETAAVGLFVSTTMTPWLTVSIWIEVSNCNFGGKKFLGNHPVPRSRGGPPLEEKKLIFEHLYKEFSNETRFSWTFPTWLVAVMSVNRETGAWLLGLENCLDTLRFQCKRIPKHRVPMQIKGGTAGVGAFLFRRQWRHDSVSIWIEISKYRVGILVARNFLETIQLGCLGGPLWKRKKWFLNILTKQGVFVNIPYATGCRDVCESWNRGLVTWFGELSWHLKVSVQNVFQNIERRCRLRVEQPVLELFCFEDNDARTQFQFELKFPTVELTFWWPEISWKPSTLAVTWGGPSEENKFFFDCRLQTVFFCLVIYQPLHWKWICANIIKNLIPMVEPTVFTSRFQRPAAAILPVSSILGSPLRRSATLTEGSI